MGTLRYEYEFDLGESAVIAYDVEIDEETLTVQPEAYEGMPEWTRLEFNQCDNCPLKPEEKSYCPVAASISRVVERFRDRISYEEASVRVSVPERTYEKRVPLQHGLFSLFGLIMATTSCPHMRFLRPMARFHLPFSSPQETIVRTVSFFLLRRYLENQQRPGVTYDLGDLDGAYSDVQGVNRGIMRRVRAVATGSAEADAGAVVILNALTKMLSASLASNLQEVEPLFGQEARC
jgi:hypothetical protein